MLTRRDFIQSTAVTLFSITPNGAPGTVRQATPKVVILGAGIAGLAAGYFLTKQGVQPTILEARPRLGGRVFSQSIDSAESLTVELGAEWIGASHERVLTLCEELRLPLQNNQFKTRLIYQGRYFRQGEWDFSKQYKETFPQLLHRYAQLPDSERAKLDQIDWWRYLVNNGIQGRDLDIRELLDSTDFGESIRFVSSFNALDEYAASSPANEMDFKIEGGNFKLINGLAAKIGADQILLNHRVVSVNQMADKIEVVCNNGDRVMADRLICTLPTFAIRQIHWQPTLPPDKIAAIDALQYNRIAKNVFVYNHRFWDDESFDLVTDGPIHYLYHATKHQRAKAGALTSYCVGDKADVLSKQSDAWRSALINNTLEPAFGTTKPYLLNQINCNWGEDRYTQGAYALYGKGQWFKLRPALAKPFGHVYFAGEHLGDWQGFMEGAVETGQHAAATVLEA